MEALANIVAEAAWTITINVSMNQSPLQERALSVRTSGRMQQRLLHKLSPLVEQAESAIDPACSHHG
jgi:hypothetical protein